MDIFIVRIFTCDVKWVNYRNPGASSHLHCPVNKQKSSLKKSVRPQIILCVCWHFEGVIHWEFVANGRAVGAYLFSSTETSSWNFDTEIVLLHQHNAWPHTARTMTKIQELEGIELLPHPAYNPDLAPSDCHLFRSIAHFLRRRNFENIQVV